MNIKLAINEGKQKLDEFKIRTSLLDSEILMSKVLKKDRAYIVMNYDKKLTYDNFNHFKNLIKERSKGKPVAYLVEKKDFWNAEFKIKRDVLIPRPDTELIIQETLKLTKNRNKLKVLDIGVGSGCILLSLLLDRNDFIGVGIDISKKCLDLARYNTLKLKLKNRIKFFKSDIDNFNYGKYDLIVSNPPYINHIDFRNLDKDISNYEPKLALYGGLDGLSVFRKVITKSSKLIKKNGKLILEIGFDQKDKIKSILRENRFYINKVFKDFANNNRCIISTKI
jgi:release factor glutamine methyltransferase